MALTDIESANMRQKAEVWGKINGVELTWPSVIKVCRYCDSIGIDPARVFFRAQENKAKNPLAWIAKGLQGPDPYAMKSCSAEYEPHVFQDWRDTVWKKGKKKGQPSQLKEIFAMMGK